MSRLTLSSSKDKKDQFILLKDEDGERDIARITFLNAEFLTEGFAEFIGTSILHEIREQIIAYNEGDTYDRNPTPFDKKKAQRVTGKIIKRLIGGNDGY